MKHKEEGKKRRGEMGNLDERTDIEKMDRRVAETGKKREEEEGAGLTAGSSP